MKSVYTTVDEEYAALRGATGLIDYSGAGLYEVSGPAAAEFLGRVATRAVDFLLEGQVSATLLLRADGTVVAEALVHCRGTAYLVEVWPAQAAAALELLTATASEMAEVTLTDVSAEQRVFGLEGPESFTVAQKFLNFPIASMAYRSFAEIEDSDLVTMISRTGVTGEYGYKLYTAAGRADQLHAELVNLGARDVGSDAVDVCRMESRFVNIERESAGRPATPFDLGLQWMVDLSRDFSGADALRDGAGTGRRPVCWQAEDPITDVPAPGTEISVSDAVVGEVSHAVWSPTLKRLIGTARVDSAVAASGLDLVLGNASIRTISAPFLVATSFGVSME